MSERDVVRKCSRERERERESYLNLQAREEHFLEGIN